MNNKWNPRNNAVLKAALFFEITHLNLDNLKNFILQNSYLFKDKNQTIKSCYDYICSLVDEFFTPFIVKEINMQKSILSGSNSMERFASFFLTSDIKWSKEALSLGVKYKIQINKITHLIQAEIQSLEMFFIHFIIDLTEIKRVFNIDVNVIQNIEITNSDRHNFSGPIIFITFVNNIKIVYKPKQMYTDGCLRSLVKIIHCEKILYYPKYINKETYSWSEFIIREFYTQKDLSLLYKNFGLQLAICDIFNFTDGHAENFVAYNKQFIPVDTETIFTNLSYFENKADNFFDLSFTGMIRPKNKKMPYLPLLRKDTTLSFFPYKPYICNDGTDLIAIQYQQTIKNPADNSFPSKKQIVLKNYFEDIIKGLNMGYNLIKQHKVEILNYLRSVNVKTRKIVRPTLYYTWLIYKYLHPDNKSFENFLNKNLHNLSDNLFTYERQYIQYGNIPVCYQKLHSRHLYGYNGRIIDKNYFSHTSYYWIKTKINSINDNFIKNREIEIKTAIR